MGKDSSTTLEKYLDYSLVKKLLKKNNPIDFYSFCAIITQ